VGLQNPWKCPRFSLILTIKPWIYYERRGMRFPGFRKPLMVSLTNNHILVITPIFPEQLFLVSAHANRMNHFNVFCDESEDIILKFSVEHRYL
jgi:hypothetical protein